MLLMAEKSNGGIFFRSILIHDKGSNKHVNVNKNK